MPQAHALERAATDTELVMRSGRVRWLHLSISPTQSLGWSVMQDDAVAAWACLLRRAMRRTQAAAACIFWAAVLARRRARMTSQTAPRTYHVCALKRRQSCVNSPACFSHACNLCLLSISRSRGCGAPLFWMSPASCPPSAAGSPYWRWWRTAQHTPGTPAAPGVSVNVSCVGVRSASARGLPQLAVCTHSVFTFLIVSSEGPCGGFAAVSIITCSFSSASS
jgi:hypothetical protein